MMSLSGSSELTVKLLHFVDLFCWYAMKVLISYSEWH